MQTLVSHIDFHVFVLKYTGVIKIDVKTSGAEVRLLVEYCKTVVLVVARVELVWKLHMGAEPPVFFCHVSPMYMYKKVSLLRLNIFSLILKLVMCVLIVICNSGVCALALGAKKTLQGCQIPLKKKKKKVFFANLGILFGVLIWAYCQF
jgi:hypothetical protein